MVLWNIRAAKLHLPYNFERYVQIDFVELGVFRLCGF